MRFEPETTPTTCETCKFIASQVDGAVTALDAFEGAVRSRDARIAALEARLADSPEVESSREAWRGVAQKMTLKLEEANKRIAALEAERDRLKELVEKPWMRWHGAAGKEEQS